MATPDATGACRIDMDITDSILAHLQSMASGMKQARAFPRRRGQVLESPRFWLWIALPQATNFFFSGTFAMMYISCLKSQ